MIAPAHRIADDAEALAAARTVADLLAISAAERDRERRYPVEELEAFSQSGLWAIRVPRSHGGAEVSFATVGKVFALIARADPSTAQLAQGHMSTVYLIGTAGSPQQQDRFWSHVLNGARIGNAAAEVGVVPGDPLQTRLVRDGDGWRLSGRKFFTTGALLSQLVAVYAQDPEGRLQVCLIPADAPGLHIADDWNGLGQRTTASGTATLDNVRVEDGDILPAWQAFPATPQNAVTHISHAGIDTGIAQAALADALGYLRAHRSPSQTDPYVLEQLGRISMHNNAADALLERAGRILDEAVATTDPALHRRADIAVYEAKVAAAEAAMNASTMLFELCGTRSTLSPHAFDRHWRNARTHTLHDPIYRRTREIGLHRLEQGTEEPQA